MTNLLKEDLQTPYTVMEIPEKILQKQFKVIGLDYEKDLIVQKDWNKAYSWNYFQKLDFLEFFLDELKKDNSLRKKLLKKSFVKTENLIKFVYNYADIYGWQDK